MERAIKSHSLRQKGKPLFSSSSCFIRTINAAKNALQDQDGQIDHRNDSLVSRLGTWFARELFGTGGVKHLHTFITASRTAIRHAPITTTTRGLSQSHIVESTPELDMNRPSLSGVVSAYHRQSDTMRQSVLTKCTRYVHLSEFFRLYTKSHKEATRNGSSVQQELKSRNLIPEKGRSWKNVYIDFLLSSFYNVSISEVKTDRKLRNQLRM